MRQQVVTTSDASVTAQTSRTIPVDLYGESSCSLQVVVTGTANWTVQQTLDDVFDPNVTPTWFNHSDTNMVSQTVNRQSNYAFIPSAVRLVQNSGDGSVTLTFVQAGPPGGR